ncbi:hypothetical protein AWE51_12950 [Aquimarina aggregata]|uniref:Uncharacterized protein n=1 Tax=Aquimarina aggregata TaxID=1642818 RepID=A0A162YYH6_9FLAO|nr:hypothetical protein [Aquimarina aggregata]KZS39440.1 hypothetical protein AWE51_12950 [Aquimarina aggregata]
MKKFFLLFLITSISFISCEKNEIDSDIETSEITVDYDQKSALQRDFARAMALALKESIPLRKFIKDEALKMFDNDYDILYHMVKNKQLSDGKKLRDVLKKYYKDENRLDEIENQVPLLTILVPTLPKNSFSAELWDVQNEVPEVAIRMNNTNHVPVINNLGEEYIIKGGHIPGFPIIVIKENERIVYNSGLTKENRYLKGAEFSTKDNRSFQFLSDAFDRSKVQNISKRRTRRLDQKILDAYDIYKNTDGWHRDYIYYDLTQNNTRDQFSFDFQEHITDFVLIDAMNAYQKIADQSGEPNYLNSKKENSSGWTGGFFEFKVKVLINARNGVGEELTTFFTAKPEELFLIEYRQLTENINIYVFESIYSKTKRMMLPLFNWDLNQYASSIKIEIEEVDLTETTTITDTRLVKFANNFSIDPTDGILKKIGLKFGASLEQNVSQSVQKKITQGNDELGEVIINFADNVYTGKKHRRRYITRRYYTGLFGISVEPIRVQN